MSGRVPGAMAAHRMPGDPLPGGERSEGTAGVLQDLQGIKPSPVFPVETERTSIVGSNDVGEILGGVGPGLPTGIHTCAMQRQNQAEAATGIAGGRWGCGARDQPVVLHGVIDLTSKSDLPGLIRLDHLD